jgi:mono/diheme cytochrome c family protein
LQGVADRRQPDWIKAFITAPDKVIASGDPVATQLVAEYNNIKMPNLGLKDAEIAALLVYLQDPAAAGAAQPAAAQPAVLPPGRAQMGQLIFTGNTKLANGGTPCIACHTVAGTGALGGGSLGPDLTQVFRRYGDPGLANALGTIAFPTMTGPFLNRALTPQEQSDLVAFFQWTDNTIPAPAPDRLGFFLLAGGLGALVLFGSMVFFWPRQRESIAERLRKSR